jgi:hypothetical protein
MTIHGLSQSTGAERLLEVEGAGAGVLLIICDPVGGTEWERIVVPADGLLSAILGRTPGPATIEGTPPGGAQRLLDVEVRRNEVLLRVRAGSDAGWDVAVGLDDFQDALERAVAAE